MIKKVTLLATIVHVSMLYPMDAMQEKLEDAARLAVVKIGAMAATASAPATPKQVLAVLRGDKLLQDTLGNSPIPAALPKNNEQAKAIGDIFRYASHGLFKKIDAYISAQPELVHAEKIVNGDLRTVLDILLNDMLIEKGSDQTEATALFKAWMQHVRPGTQLALRIALALKGTELGDQFGDLMTQKSISVTILHPKERHIVQLQPADTATLVAPSAPEVAVTDHSADSTAVALKGAVLVAKKAADARKAERTTEEANTDEFIKKHDISPIGAEALKENFAAEREQARARRDARKAKEAEEAAKRQAGAALKVDAEIAEFESELGRENINNAKAGLARATAEGDIVMVAFFEEALKSCHDARSLNPSKSVELGSASPTASPEDEKKLAKMVDDLTADPVVAPAAISIPAAAKKLEEIDADEAARLAREKQEKEDAELKAAQARDAQAARLAKEAAAADRKARLERALGKQAPSVADTSKSKEDVECKAKAAEAERIKAEAARVAAVNAERIAKEKEEAERNEAKQKAAADRKARLARALGK